MMSSSIPTGASGMDPEHARGEPSPVRLLRGAGRTGELALEDARSADPAERLLEDSWEARNEQGGRRELIVEGVAVGLFLLCAVPLAVVALAAHHLDVPLAALLVVLYALAARIKFPIGAGYVVLSYLVLVPMLLLPPV